MTKKKPTPNVRPGDRFRDNDARLQLPSGEARCGEVVAVLADRAIVLWNTGRRTRVSLARLCSRDFTRLA